VASKLVFALAGTRRDITVTGGPSAAHAPRVRFAWWPVGGARRASYVALVGWVVGTAVGYLRIPARGRDTLYAEDGQRFIGDWLAIHSWAVLYQPYMGYQHLLPRIVSGLVVAMLPIGWWADAMSLLACALVGAGAVLVYVFSRDVVSSPVARFGLAAVMVLCPIAGIEAVGNLANLHWYLLYLMPWVLLAVPRSTRAAVLMAILALVITLTEPQCVLFAPLAVFSFKYRRSSRLVVIGWLAGLFLQAVTYFNAPRMRTSGAPPLASTVKGYLVNAVLSNGSSNHVTVGRLLRNFGWGIGVVSLCVFLAFAAFACLRGNAIVRVAVPALLFASAAGWVGAFYINNNPQYFYSALRHDQLVHVPLVRWGTAAAMLLIAVIPVAAGVLISRNPRWWPTASATVVLTVIVMGFNLTSPDNIRAGPRWHFALKNAAATCKATKQKTVEVTTTPVGWHVLVRCSHLR
jgi:hypothetical protein